MKNKFFENVANKFKQSMAEQISRDSYVVLPDTQQKSEYPTIVGDVIALNDDGDEVYDGVAEVEFIAPATGRDIVRKFQMYRLREPTEEEYQRYKEFIENEHNINFL